MRVLPCLVVLAALVASPARASVPLAPLAPERVSLLDAALVPAAGGGDGIVTGPTRTIGWILLLGGGAAAAGGVALFQRDSSNPMGLTIAGGGGVAAIVGGFLIWSTGCISCATCGIVENRRGDEPPPREALASNERQRPGPGRGDRVAWLALRF